MNECEYIILRSPLNESSLNIQNVNLMAPSPECTSSNTNVLQFPFREACADIPNVNDEKVEFKWAVNGTKLLIDLYHKYRKKVGTFEIKTVKHMWQRIAKELSEILKTTISANNCENRWRVLDRNYKKYVDNQTSTGRGRKFFEYAEEMENLLGGKKSVRPQLLLSNETIDTPHNIEEIQEVENAKDCTEETPKKPKTMQTKRTPEIQSKSVRKRKTSLLELIRQDRLDYQKKRLELEKEKLNEMKRRNDLIQQRNDFLASQGSK